MSRPHNGQPVPSKVDNSKGVSLITPPLSVSEIEKAPKSYLGQPIETWSEKRMREMFFDLLFFRHSDMGSRCVDTATNELHQAEKFDPRIVVEDPELYFKTLELLEKEECGDLKPMAIKAREGVEREKVEGLEAADTLLLFSKYAVLHPSSRDGKVEGMVEEPSEEEVNAANILLSMRYAPVGNTTVEDDGDTDIDERYR